MTESVPTDLGVCCEYCGKGFRTINGLKIHCSKVHALEMDLEKIGFEVLGKHVDCDCMGCRPWAT